MARSRSQAQTRTPFIEHLRQQFHQHKNHIFVSCALVLLALPRLIMSFISGCMQSSRNPWLYLFGYLISFIPSMITFIVFILPSKKYKDELTTMIQRTIQRFRNILQQIKRAKRICDEEVEPKTLGDFTLPDAYSITLSRMDFAKDITDGTERILLFTTSENLKWLQEAKFWIMDGTFKTVPTLFRQLYSIHAPAGGNVNFRIVPLVYALMSNKSEELYQRLFQELNELADENELELKPDFVLTDFEKGSINAVKFEYPSAQSKGCHFHLGHLLIRHSPALAFLSPLEIPDAFDELKVILPSDAEPIIQWFENNYAHRRIKRILRNGRVQRHNPLYPPEMWSVFDNIEFVFRRTQNKVEAWHRRWKTLIARAHVGTFTMIKQIQKEQNEVEMEIE
ncbi:unnamed protein product [Rotaria sp. Silwood2]|nr:unnamed protein product [Rotaria sp. Silwood2]